MVSSAHMCTGVGPFTGVQVPFCWLYPPKRNDSSSPNTRTFFTQRWHLMNSSTTSDRILGGLHLFRSWAGDRNCFWECKQPCHVWNSAFHSCPLCPSELSVLLCSCQFVSLRAEDFTDTFYQHSSYEFPLKCTKKSL